MCKYKKKTSLGILVYGLLSLFWLVFRSGRKPDRLRYPCQRLAASNVLLFFAWLGSVITGWLSYRKIKEKLTWSGIGITIVLVLLVVSGVKYYRVWQDNLKPREVWGQSSRSTVVWVKNTNATNGWAGDSSKVNEAVVRQMLDQAIMQLVNTNSVESAWSQILPCGSNCSNKKIAIKVNFNNSSGSGTDNSCYRDHCPTTQVINALLKQLIENKGLSQSNITVYDTSRGFPDYYSQAIRSRYPNVRLNPDRSQRPPCSVDESVLGAHFGCALAEADYLINMPLLRTHGNPGVTLSLKNHLGSTLNCKSFHSRFSSGAGQNSLVLLNSHPFIKGKTILVVADGLYGLKRGGPGCRNGCAQDSNFFNANSIFVSVDPIAVDSVMIDYLASEGSSFNGKDARFPYRLAAEAGLGNFGTSCSGNNCSFSYSNINLIKQNGAETTVFPTGTPVEPDCAPCSNGGYKSQGDANCDGRIDSLDYTIWVSEYLQEDKERSSWLADFNCDGVVNAMDFNILLQYIVWE